MPLLPLPTFNGGDDDGDDVAPGFLLLLLETIGVGGRLYWYGHEAYMFRFYVSISRKNKDYIVYLFGRKVRLRRLRDDDEFAAVEAAPSCYKGPWLRSGDSVAAAGGLC